MADINSLSKDLYILEDENNPQSSRADNIWPSTILDQVYDQLSPTKKTLRTLLEELHQDIISGGLGNIVFPVTSVNGMEGDVVLIKDHFGLENVDNTSDMDKPLSDPQRAAVVNMLENYEYDVDLSDLYDHIMNSNNPHAVTIDQLNEDGDVDHLIIRAIEIHNTKDDAHADIRANMDYVLNMASNLNSTLTHRMDTIVDMIDAHATSAASHNTLFDAKEDRSNKVTTFNIVDHVKFPTVRAVVDYVAARLEDFRDIIDADQPSLLDLIVVTNRSQLPPASESVTRKIYLVQNGEYECVELAVCRNTNNVYSWDITSLDILPSLNQSQFERTRDGISVKYSALAQSILDDSNITSYLIENVQENIRDIMEDYYRKDEIEEMGLVSAIEIIPGTDDGTIRYFINHDRNTMSDDIRVTGLSTIAFLDRITGDYIEDEAIEGRHMKNHSITGSCLADRAVETRCLTAEYNTILGNVDETSTNRVEEIPIQRLAEILYPYIAALADENDLLGHLSNP